MSASPTVPVPTPAQGAVLNREDIDGPDERPDDEPDDPDEHDLCPKCGRYTLVHGYGKGFGPGIGAYEGCIAPGCGHRNKTIDPDG